MTAVTWCVTGFMRHDGRRRTSERKKRFEVHKKLETA
jgi:hypothetical protein